MQKWRPLSTLLYCWYMFQSRPKHDCFRVRLLIHARDDGRDGFTEGHCESSTLHINSPAVYAYDRRSGTLKIYHVLLVIIFSLTTRYEAT